MATLVIPNTFTPNTVAQSSQVNANFNAVATLLNSTLLDSSNIAVGGIATASLADGAVKAIKLNADVVDGTTISLDSDNAVQVVDAGITLAKLAAAVAQALVPTSSLVAFGGSTAPTGWLICDGTAVSRTTYATLFGVIGIANGAGDGVTTFNLPDMRGNFLRGTDNMGVGARGQDPDSASRGAANTGGNTGNAVGSYQGDQYLDHAHSISAFSVGYASGGNTTIQFNNAGPGVSESTNNSGGNQTNPRNIYQNFIIKT